MGWPPSRRSRCAIRCGRGARRSAPVAPVVPTHRHAATVRTSAVTLASFADRVPFIVEKTHGAGRVLFVNASADRSWGKWQTDGALFVVTAHLLAVRAAGQAENHQRDVTTQGIAGQTLTLSLPENSAGQAFELNKNHSRRMMKIGLSSICRKSPACIR